MFSLTVKRIVVELIVHQMAHWAFRQIWSKLHGAENAYRIEIDEKWQIASQMPWTHHVDKSQLNVCRNIGNAFFFLLRILDNRSWTWNHLTWNQFDVWLVLWTRKSEREVYIFELLPIVRFMNDSCNKSDKLNESQVKTFSLNCICPVDKNVSTCAEPKACQPKRATTKK